MKKKGILYSISLITFNRILSLILGFVRDIVWADVFGAALSFDAFIIAFHLPSFISFLISEAGLTQVFIPLLSERQIRSDYSEVKKFIAHITAILVIVISLIISIAIVFAPLIIKIFAPGLAEIKANLHLTVSLFRIMSIGIVFATFSALYSAVLNTFDSFGIPSFTPLILNVFTIFASFYFTPYFNVPIYGLAWGVLLGGFFQWVLQIPFVKRKNLMIKPNFHIDHNIVRKLLRRGFPAFITVSVFQIGVLIDFIFSSYLPNGSITWLYYSTRLMEVPVTVFSVAIITVALPNLGRSYAKEDNNSYNQLLDWSIRSAFLVGMPASVGLFALAGPILITLFQHGFFTYHDVVMAKKSTDTFALGICGFMILKVCATAFYARQNTKFPAKVSVIALLSNVFFNFLFFKHLAHAGLALATSLSGVINAAILFFFLIEKKYYQPTQDLMITIIKFMIAALIMFLLLQLVTPNLTDWLNNNTEWRILHLISDLVMAVMVYIISLGFMGIRLTHFIRNHGHAVVVQQG